MLDEKSETMVDDDITVKIKLFTPLTVEHFNKKNIELRNPILSNLQTLCARLNLIGAQWGQEMVVTSGLRSQGQQEEMIKAGKTKASKSKHLDGCAADIYDPNGILKMWLRENPKALEDAQLWCEHGDYTPTWCHFQIVPPRSGNRWFIP